MVKTEAADGNFGPFKGTQYDEGAGRAERNASLLACFTGHV